MLPGNDDGRAAVQMHAPTNNSTTVRKAAALGPLYVVKVQVMSLFKASLPRLSLHLHPVSPVRDVSYVYLD